MNARLSPIRTRISPRASASRTTSKGDGKTVIRGGFGIYYSQIVDNSQANYALTGPTGVFNYTAAPGQIGFPTSVTAVPCRPFPRARRRRCAASISGPARRRSQSIFPHQYVDRLSERLLNPYSEQWTFGIERRLAPGWVLRADYVGSHTLQHQSAAGCGSAAPFIRTRRDRFAPRRPRTARVLIGSTGIDEARHGVQSQRGHQSAAALRGDSEPMSTTATAYYDALDVNLSHRFSRASACSSVTCGRMPSKCRSRYHRPESQRSEFHRQNRKRQRDLRSAPALRAKRHVHARPGKINFGGVVNTGTGLPYNFTTGVTNSGGDRRDHRSPRDQRRGSGPQHRPRAARLRFSPHSSNVRSTLWNERVHWI